MSVSDLLSSGAHVEWPEALALVQQIASSSSASQDLEALYLTRDGQIVAAPPESAADGLDASPDNPIHLLAELLRRFLPPPDAKAGPAVPPGLRYTVIRALGGVTAPPIQSMAEFSRALARFEQGDRTTLLKRLSGRASAVEVPGAGRHAKRPRRPAEQGRTVADATDRTPPPALHWDELPLRREARTGARTAWTELEPVSAERRPVSAEQRAFSTVKRPRRQNAAGPFLTAVAALAILMAAAVVSAAVVITVQGPHSEVLAAIRPQIAKVRQMLGAADAAPAQDGGQARSDGQLVPAQPSSTSPSPSREDTGTSGPTPGAGAAMGTAGGASGVRTPGEEAPSTGAGETAALLDAPGRLVEALDAANRPIFSPFFAADGSAIFSRQFGANGGSAREEARKPGTHSLRILSVLADGARNYHPHLSPDGTAVAFDSDRDGVRGIYLADRNGHNIRRVSGEGYAAVPAWSPDGRRLAFVKADSDNSRVWNVWMLDLSSGEAERLTAHRSGQSWGASWFPDGQRICYSHEDQLIVLDTASGASQAYPSPRKGRLVRTPAVSPDGRHAIFQLYREGAWVIDFGDGSMRKVLDDQTADEFTWSPDGSRAAYHSRRDGRWNVWVAR